MKHLIKDTELVAYLEGTLNKEEIKKLKIKLKENDELSLLYHLELSYENSLENYANELIGKDDFYIETTPEDAELNTSNKFRMAADIFPPTKEE